MTNNCINIKQAWLYPKLSEIILQNKRSDVSLLTISIKLLQVAKSQDSSIYQNLFCQCWKSIRKCFSILKHNADLEFFLLETLKEALENNQESLVDIFATLRKINPIDLKNNLLFEQILSIIFEFIQSDMNDTIFTDRGTALSFYDTYKFTSVFRRFCSTIWDSFIF